MNKKISVASRDEIKALFQNDDHNAIKLISHLRKDYFYKPHTNEETGEIYNVCPFSLTTAKKHNFELEYRLYFAMLKRRQRLRDRIEKMIKSEKAVFLTLTFNNNYLSRKMSAETRRRYVARFLKSECSEYIANIDFGQDERYTKREHYHAVAIPKDDKIDFTAYSEGFDKSRISSLAIKVNRKSRDNLARYIDKLTNHALKHNGHYQRLIYSRT